MADISTNRGLAPMKSSLLRWLAVLVVLALLLALPWIAKAAGSSATILLATRILIFAIAAGSLNLVLGIGGMVSFGHAAFFGIGGYVVAILGFHHADGSLFMGLVPGTNQLLIALPVAVLVTAIFAALIGALSLRTGGVQFIMITLAFAQMAFFLFSALTTYGGEDGLMMRRPNEFLGLNLRQRPTMYFVALGAAALCFFGFYRFMNSSFCTVLDGLRQNPRRMAAIGIAPYRYRLLAFVLSGAGTGLAGALMANVLRFTSPDMLSWNLSGQFMIMVILGGVGTLWGPLIGAAVLLILEDKLNGLTEHWPLILGLLLLVVVLRTPGGLMALTSQVTGRMRK
ncbi:branched-chain amino acid ABC transporter permease [Antarcticimicrobium sediminis]|nr:branched-chain amino acid ABC transporter permease [Antarcticimicrobium sediminis]